MSVPQLKTLYKSNSYTSQPCSNTTQTVRATPHVLDISPENVPTPEDFLGANAEGPIQYLQTHKLSPYAIIYLGRIRQTRKTKYWPMFRGSGVTQRKAVEGFLLLCVHTTYAGIFWAHAPLLNVIWVCVRGYTQSKLLTIGCSCVCRPTSCATFWAPAPTIECCSR